MARIRDTTRFEAPARANPCGGGHGVLLQGAREGNGAVVWLRTPDTIDTGVWPLLQRADTLSPHGAVVGVRFMVGDGAHGAALDSGSVSVTRNADSVTVGARGTGFETAITGRVSVDVRFDPLPLGRDTVSCRHRL